MAQKHSLSILRRLRVILRWMRRGFSEMEKEDRQLMKDDPELWNLVHMHENQANLF